MRPLSSITWPWRSLSEQLSNHLHRGWTRLPFIKPISKRRSNGSLSAALIGINTQLVKLIFAEEVVHPRITIYSDVWQPGREFSISDWGFCVGIAYCTESILNSTNEYLRQAPGEACKLSRLVLKTRPTQSLPSFNQMETLTLLLETPID